MRPKPSEDGNRNRLPRSLYVQQKDPRAALRQIVYSVFSDKFMIFLSLILIPIIILPFILTLSPDILVFFEICDIIILVLFISEYLLKLYVAQDHWSHFKSPWHCVDLLIITLPFMQYLPLLDLAIVGSPSLLLRLLRVPRVVAVGGRVIASRRNIEIAYKQEKVQYQTVIREVSSNLKIEHNLTWDDLKANLAEKDCPEWFDIQYITNEGFNKLSSFLKIPETHFKCELVDEIYPHIDYVQTASFIFLQSGSIHYPAENQANYLTILRSGVIVICTGKKIITISRHNLDMIDEVVEALKQKKPCRWFCCPRTLWHT